MASKYDDLDASTELEQRLFADLRAALNGRGCVVIHHGTNSGGRHAPGGKPDLEIRDTPNGRLILVEVTRRKSSSADGEFIAVTDHLDKAVAAGGYDDYGVLYVSPATSARLSANFRDLWNRSREREGKQGRVVAIDFEAAEMLTTKLAAAPSELYPASRLGDLFRRWDEASDDSLARLLVQQAIFPEDHGLKDELQQEVDQFAADRERRLKVQLEKIEDDLRDRGIVGNEANVVLLYLTFLRLYEERRQRMLGVPNRFTTEGFSKWVAHQPAAVANPYKERMVEALLHEIAEDTELQQAGLLRDAAGVKYQLHEKMRDTFVKTKLLPVYDEYDFHAGRVDVLGAVFETLARRGEKDTRIGQFFTPQPVVDFCADVVPLTPRDVVLDPAVGTARFLIRAMGLMLERAGDGVESRRDAEHAIRAKRLLGTDIGNWVATIAKMNMFIHGDGKTNIREANGLVLGDRGCFAGFPTGISERIDVVLTNPPLGDTSHVVAVENWIGLASESQERNPTALLTRLGVVPLRMVEQQQLTAAEAALHDSDELVRGLEAVLPDPGASAKLPAARRTRDSRADKVAKLRAAIGAGAVRYEPTNSSMKGGALFLGAIADYLKPIRDPDAKLEARGGWAAVVVDEAILNTPDYAATRKFIRDRFYVKGVVSLGRQAFKYLAHTDAKTSILFLVRKAERGKAQREPIFFAHAERVGYGPTGDWVGDDLRDVRTVFAAVRTAVASEYRGAWLDPQKALTAAQSVNGFGSAFYVTGVAAGASRLDFYYARYLQRISELKARFGTLGMLGDYMMIARPEHPEPNRRGEYPFAEVSRVTGTVEPKGVQKVNYSANDMWVVRDGDIVVSGIDVVNGSVGVATIDVDGMVMSGEMYAYRVKDNQRASPVYLQLLLRSQAARDLLTGMTTGTSNRTRLESPELLLELPVPPLPHIAEQRRAADAFSSAAAAYRSAIVSRRVAEDSVAYAWAPDIATVGPADPTDRAAD